MTSLLHFRVPILPHRRGTSQWAANVFLLWSWTTIGRKQPWPVSTYFAKYSFSTTDWTEMVHRKNITIVAHSRWATEGWAYWGNLWCGYILRNGFGRVTVLVFGRSNGIISRWSHLCFGNIGATRRYVSMVHCIKSCCFDRVPRKLFSDSELIHDSLQTAQRFALPSECQAASHLSASGHCSS